MFRRTARSLLSVVVGVVVLPAALMAGDNDVVAYRLAVVTTDGVTFTGLVSKTQQTEETYGEGGEIDPSTFPQEKFLQLRNFNGLRGSVSFRYRELKKITVSGSVTEKQARENSKKDAAARQVRLKKEAMRLEIVNAARALRAAARKKQQSDAPVKQATEVPKELQPWLDEFPPEDGWVPAKRAQLYYLSVVLNTHTLTVKEQRWVNNFDTWKKAYDLWLGAEETKVEQEEAAKEADAAGQPGPEPPHGKDRPDPSGTSRSDAAKVDPDHPTPEQASKLPPPINKSAPEPVKVSSEAPKPAKIPSSVPEPEPIKPEPTKKGGGT